MLMWPICAINLPKPFIGGFLCKRVRSSAIIRRPWRMAESSSSGCTCQEINLWPFSQACAIIEGWKFISYPSWSIVISLSSYTSCWPILPKWRQLHPPKLYFHKKKKSLFIAQYKRICAITKYDSKHCVKGHCLTILPVDELFTNYPQRLFPSQKSKWKCSHVVPLCFSSILIRKCFAKMY